MIAFIDNPERLRNFIQQEPLIAIQPSLEGIANLQSPINPTSLYFGIGLANKEKVSEDLPIDVLSMILVAERLGVQGKKYILIADVHARANIHGHPKEGRCYKGYLNFLSDTYEMILRDIVTNLNLSNWEILKASEASHSEVLFHLFRNHHEQGREYLYEQLELADMETFEKNANVKLKIGWAFDSGGNLDETQWDKAYKEKFPQSGMSFLYVKPGMTFNPSKLRMPPYFCDDIDSRIGFMVGSLIDYGVQGKIECSREKYGEQGIQCYRNYLKRLVRLFDSVVEPTRKGTLEQKLQEILGRCLK